MNTAAEQSGYNCGSKRFGPHVIFTSSEGAAGSLTIRAFKC